MNPGDPITFINIEWFFRLLYGILSVVLFIGSAFVAFIQSFFDGVPGVGFGSNGGETARILGEVWNAFTMASTLASLVLGVVVVYALIRLRQVDDLRKKRLEQGVVVSTAAVSVSPKNMRWEKVQALMKSTHENDWRQAIIEADIMLEEMLTVQGYTGESIGEKLKQIERSDMDTLDDAWAAHKVRNQIAHAGSGYLLTEREARVTIAQFENVFREFGLI